MLGQNLWPELDPMHWRGTLGYFSLFFFFGFSYFGSGHGLKTMTPDPMHWQVKLGWSGPSPYDKFALVGDKHCTKYDKFAHNTVSR
jgi:hypothetical protein